MEKQKKFQFPLNIQLFAEQSGTNDDEHENKEGSNQEKTYSQQEYDKLKSSFDLTSSELAKLKKEAKAKLTEDERKQKEQEEKDARLKELELKVLTSDMTSELLSSGLEKSSVSKIIESYKSGDMIELCKTISKEIVYYVDKVKKEAKAEFQRNGTRPPLGEYDKNDDNKLFMDSLINRKSNESTKNVRDYYLNKNKR